MKPKFSSLPRPFLANIVIENNIEDTIRAIQTAEKDGAVGFVVYLSGFSAEERTPENLRRIVECTECPTMALAYRESEMSADKFTDDMRVEEWLKAVEAGFPAVDIMGDMFDPSPRELTRNPEAIEKQKELIRQLHEKGAEVLMSSHMKEPLTAEEVLEHLLNQQERGADIAKIVVTCETEEHLIEAAKTVALLKEKLSIPFVFLGSGKYGRLQRFLAPTMGAMLTFSLNDERCGPTVPQPTASYGSKTLDYLVYRTAAEE